MFQSPVDCVAALPGYIDRFTVKDEKNIAITEFVYTLMIAQTAGPIAS